MVSGRQLELGREPVLTMSAVEDKDQLVLLRVKIEATPIYSLLKS